MSYQIDLTANQKEQIFPMFDIKDEIIYGFYHNSTDSTGETQGRKFFAVSSTNLDAILNDENLKEMFEFKSETMDDDSVTLPPLPLGKKIKEYQQMASDEEIFKATFRMIRAKFEDRIYFSNQINYDICALYVMLTYFYPLFDAVPFLFLNGTRGTGKTETLKLFRLMSRTPLMTNNMSESALFRSVQALQPTMLVDEAENLKSKDGENPIITVLNSRYKKDGGYVIRTGEKKDGFKTEKFYVYGPTVIANIIGLNTTLKSRTILITTERTDNPKFKQVKLDNDWAQIREACLVNMFLNFKRVKSTTSETFDTDLANRDYEIWKPILCMAKLVSDELFGNLIRYGVEHAVLQETMGFFEDLELVTIMTLLKNVETASIFTAQDIRDIVAAEIGDKDGKSLSLNTMSFKLIQLGFERVRTEAGKMSFRITREKLLTLEKLYSHEKIKASTPKTKLAVELPALIPNEGIDLSTLIETIKRVHASSDADIEYAIDALKRDGRLYEPYGGFVKKVL